MKMDWDALRIRGSSEDGASGGDAVPTLPRGSQISWDLGNSKGAGGRILGRETPGCPTGKRKIVVGMEIAAML